MKKSYKMNPHIQECIDIVENRTYAVCEEQILLIEHIKWCIENEDIYVDDEQLEKYMGLAKYFPFDQVFPWQ